MYVGSLVCANIITAGEHKCAIGFLLQVGFVSQFGLSIGVTLKAIACTQLSRAVENRFAYPLNTTVSRTKEQ